MASSQPHDKDSASKTFRQTSARNDSQSTKRRSKSFNARAAAGQIAVSSARPTSYLDVSSANKDMSPGKYTALNNPHRAPAGMPSYGAKEQQNARRQPDMMLREPEVVFVHSDITELRADVIVCPVSPMLDTAKGISRVVMEKAGSGLRNAYAAKRRERTLPIGHAFVTGCFNLRNCTHIIHVVVPKMPDNKNQDTCIRDLEKAFDNCFEELGTVRKRGPGGMGRVETIAMPALGAGTNKIPRTIVATVMCKAVRKFLCRGGSLAPHLRKIILVSLDDLMLISLREEWDASVQPRRSRDNGGGRSGVSYDVKPHYHGRGGPTMQGSTWYDVHMSNSKGYGGSRTETVGANGGAGGSGGGMHNAYHHSHDRGSSSMSSSTWFDRDDHGGGKSLHLSSHGALVARGVTVGDRGGTNYPLSGKMDQPKQGDWLKNGGTSHDTGSDSDSAQGACGGAYDPKSRKGYQPYDQIDGPQGINSIWATPGRRSVSADSRNKASGSDYTYQTGIGHDLPCSEVGYNSKTNHGGGQYRRPESSGDSNDENGKVNIDRTKSLTIKDDESCPICFDLIVAKNSESLPMCGHKVCKDCWKELKLRDPICPVCRKVYGELRGSQPRNARMTFQTDQHIRLPGYERFGAIIIDYAVPNGRQTEEHPNPGKPYTGTQRRAYLPNNPEGKEVLRLLEKAFKARLTFTIGRSVTSGTDDVVTWNDIHHKTNISGKEFGYPDPTYLTRVKEELAAKGIK